MMGLLMASYIALWILVALLTVALASLAKQIGLLHRRIAPVGARIMNVGPSIGDTITPFIGTDIHGSSVSIPSPDGRTTAVVFVSSTCAACDELAPALRSIAEHEKANLKIVLASFNGDEATNRAYATKHDLGHLDFIFSPDLARTFSILTAPYALLVDRMGVLRTKGLVNSREHIESLLNTVDGGYESIQAFQFAQERTKMISDKGDIGTRIVTEESVSGD
jgi:methylamine dehydrogenase accessory protein MauD